MKSVAGLVGLSDAGECSPEAALTEPVEELRVQRAAASAAMLVAGNIESGLDRPPKGRVEIEGVRVRESDCLVAAFEDEPGMSIGRRRDALSHLIGGRDIEFPTHRGVLDVGAVDR